MALQFTRRVALSASRRRGASFLFHRSASTQQMPHRNSWKPIRHTSNMNDDDVMPAQAELDVDLSFELEEFDSTSVTGDGLFYPDDWLLLDGKLDSYQSIVAEDCPIFLNTAVRWQETDKIWSSKVHDRHPFLGFLSLLENAQENSAVYLSIPYLTDKYVIDQLCHYADPRYGGLQIYIILGPHPMNHAFLKKFISDTKEAQIRTALSRLHIKTFGFDDDTMESFFSHSKAMVSTAGAMIGSYNYTAKARLRHFEHAVLLDADCKATQLLREELSTGWENIPSKEMVFPAPQRQPTTECASVNPYAKNPAIYR